MKGLIRQMKRLILKAAQPNNSFNPTALSVPLINLVSCDVA
ncbi:MAG: hypothetical protein QOE33_2284 [Acidobacteriota bacterium]|nr:hypothetical protein [Acidobacteriota bacterium]